MVLSMSKVSQVITPDKFKVDKSKLTLYFGKFKYKVSIAIEGIHHFRLCKTEFGYHERVASKASLSFDRLKTEVFVNWRSTLVSTANMMIRIHYDKADIYSNNLSSFQSLLDNFDVIDDYVDIKYSVVKPMKNFERDVIYHKNPKHNFRIFLASKKWSKQEIRELDEWLKKYNAQPSRSLTDWINPTYKSNLFAYLPATSHSLVSVWSWGNYSFDLDDEHVITLLGLQHDEWISKVCRIEKKINT